MSEDHHHRQKPTTPADNLPPPPNPNVSGQIDGSNCHHHKIKYPNPPEKTIPDVATLRDQWRYAIRQYSKWYSHAWGTAILAGISFFALGWVIKGGNPIPSFQKNDDVDNKTPPPAPPTDSPNPPR